MHAICRYEYTMNKLIHGVCKLLLAIIIIIDCRRVPPLLILILCLCVRAVCVHVCVCVCACICVCMGGGGSRVEYLQLQPQGLQQGLQLSYRLLGCQN